MESGHIHHKIHIRENKNYKFSNELIEKINKLIERYPKGKQKSALIPLLHLAQEEFEGYLNVDIMDLIAQMLNIKPVEVYEVATFYSQFYTEKTGKYVLEVCQTSSCAVCGGEDIIEHLEKKLNIKKNETTSDGLFTLKGVECLGGCGYAPVMQVNTEFYEFLTIEKIDNLIEQLRQKSNEPKEINLKWEERLF